MEGEKLTRVVVADVQMPFGSMVTFMVKWALASIPALLFLTAIVYAAYTALLTAGGLFRAVSSSATMLISVIGGIFIVGTFGASYGKNGRLTKVQWLWLGVIILVWVSAIVAAAGYAAGYRLVSPAEWWASR